MKPDSTAIQRFQVLKNLAMCTITGCHKIADQDHLLAKTGFLPVSEHLRLLCCQFLSNAHQDHHPSHGFVKTPTGNRKVRKEIVHTLQSRFLHKIQPYLNNDDILPSANYNKTLESILTSIVAENKRLIKSKLLGTTPSKISPEEKTLPRRTGVFLSQLRSMYCNKLKTYQARIGTSPDDIARDVRVPLTLWSTSLTALLILLLSPSVICGSIYGNRLTFYTLLLPLVTLLLTFPSLLVCLSHPLWLRTKVLWQTNQPTDVTVSGITMIKRWRE
jgi:hypothetical protein